MSPFAIALLAALQVPAATPAARPGSATGSGTPYDSTAAAIVTMGYRVGYVRGALGQLRLIVFNQPTNIVSGAERTRQRCQDLERSAPEEGRRLCRSCLTASAQAAVERYRRRMEPLRALGAECARMLEPLAAGRGPVAVDRARRTVAEVNARAEAALRLYEGDLALVRVAFGWAAPPAAAPRPR